MTSHILLNNPPAGPHDREAPGHGAANHRADGELVEALRHGETWAIEELHHTLTPAMVAVAMRYTGCRAAADDIVQDTWLGVLQGISRFEGRCRLQTWIFRILHYRSRTYSSRTGRTVALSQLGITVDDDFAPARWLLERTNLPALAPRWASPEDHALSGELTTLVIAGLAELPAAQRAVFVLYDVYGWTSEEVCQRLQLSPGNQRVLLHRARRSLQRALGAYWHGEDHHPEAHAGRSAGSRKGASDD